MAWFLAGWAAVIVLVAPLIGRRLGRASTRPKGRIVFHWEWDGERWRIISG